jgi:hypothetical protein
MPPARDWLYNFYVGEYAFFPSVQQEPINISRSDLSRVCDRSVR